MQRITFPVTVHLFFLCDDQILLSRRFQTGYRDGEYSVPAGHLDGGETVVAAAVREAGEEIGVQIETGNIQFLSVMHRIEGEERVDFFVRVRKWEGEPHNAEPHKCDDLRWANLQALPQNTIPYVRKAIQNYLDEISFDEFGWK